MHRFLAWGALGVGLAVVAAAATAPGTDVEARRKAFDDLVAEQWEYNLSTSPEFASILGDKRWNDKVSDFSQTAIDADLAKSKEFLTRFQAVDATGFPEQEALTRTLLIRSFQEQLDNAHFRNWEMPISQIGGVHLFVPQLVSLLSFETVKDYDDYIARLKQIPTLFDQTIVQMRKGMAEGLMPPRFLLEKVSTQCEGIAAQKPEDTPFARPLADDAEVLLGRRSDAPARGDARGDPRRGPARVREARRLRQDGVRAAWTDGARHVVAAGRSGPVRRRGQEPDHDGSDARPDPPDRPRTGRADRGRRCS